uniref:RxLR effector protein n=1 Tax=Phytophthora agathidicida TaxID=1642459 RepID=A0A7G4WI31_9STRA|nr:PaRXLR42 [Phytophthora agathidicida]
MRLGYLLLMTIGGLVACSDSVIAVSDSKMSKIISPDQTIEDELSGGFHVNRDDKRALRARDDDDAASGKGVDDEEERDMIISTVERPKYRRWFHAGMTPYDVKTVLGLTGVRRLWKPIKRREYDGYVVYYEEHCRKPKYKAFCRAHADK